MTIIFFLTAMLLTYFAWSVFYQLVYALAGHFFTNEKGKADASIRRFAVFIPAYKEDAVIIGTAKAALKQNYPSDKYQVVVVADQLKSETIRELRSLPLSVVEVQFEKSTKSKSLNVAIQATGDGFDGAVVLDADNHIGVDFLAQMNETMGKGFRAIQGCRAAKNMQNNLSILDGVSEAINNHILCKGHRAVGLSARLAGSGMAFDYLLFKKVMSTVDALGGFDKELELKITQLGETIAYAPNAIAFDEKVGNPGTFARQRGRWLAAQYRYGRRFGPMALRALVENGNVDFFNKAIQMALPPRLLLPGLLAIGALVSLVPGVPFSGIWLVLMALNISCFALAIPRTYWQPAFFKALLGLPLAFASTLKAMALMPLAGKSFLHTPHNAVVISTFEN